MIPTSKKKHNDYESYGGYAYGVGFSPFGLGFTRLFIPLAVIILLVAVLLPRLRSNTTVIRTENIEEC